MHRTCESMQAWLALIERSCVYFTICACAQRKVYAIVFFFAARENSVHIELIVAASDHGHAMPVTFATYCPDAVAAARVVTPPLVAMSPTTGLQCVRARACWRNARWTCCAEALARRLCWRQDSEAVRDEHGLGGRSWSMASGRPLWERCR